jgi:hypothetical protein
MLETRWQQGAQPKTRFSTQMLDAIGPASPLLEDRALHSSSPPSRQAPASLGVQLLPEAALETVPPSSSPAVARRARLLSLFTSSTTAICGLLSTVHSKPPCPSSNPRVAQGSRPRPSLILPWPIQLGPSVSVRDIHPRHPPSSLLLLCRKTQGSIGPVPPFLCSTDAGRRTPISSLPGVQQINKYSFVRVAVNRCIGRVEPPSINNTWRLT